MALGRRIRLRREALRVSQARLGAALGVSFQQIQKYEKGANRLSCAMLLRVAEVLEVPSGYFLDGLGPDIPDAAAAPAPTAEALRLAGTLDTIKSPRIRAALRALAGAIARDAGG